ncbi:MAG: 16S rRNA (guanine(966)-N(2))-methyltransferase RsmD [Acidobacteria bacterium]|nr:16S rRNA (guanine(966)-N(2))-methyltransferase RsmD [Acidobacteriota bacterium]MBI3654862.1 16S rRNA (guanine(966)-N(2))-methyltransferase RsmD [Acidobacteriota bacterium]
MRVITGRYKGRRLLTPPDYSLRPTSDRVKESLFDILGSAVSGSTWLDLFAGTGSIGIEALSRGAAHVIFVEEQVNACRLIESNIHHCRIEAGFTVMRSAAARALNRLAKEKQLFDIIFIDPPYQSGLYEIVLETIARGALLKSTGVAIAEHDRRIALHDEYVDLYRRDTRRYGTTCLSFFAR